MSEIVCYGETGLFLSHIFMKKSEASLPAAWGTGRHVWNIVMRRRILRLLGKRMADVRGKKGTERSGGRLWSKTELQWKLKE